MEFFTTIRTFVRTTVLTASFLALAAGSAFSQTVVGGDTIDASAMLDVQASDKGILLPRLSTAQRNAMTRPAFGLLVINTTLQCLEINLGTPDVPTWKCLSTGQDTLDFSTLDTAYWNRKLNPSDTLSLSARINAKLSAYTESDPVFNTSLAKGITAQDTAYWNRKLNPSDTLSLSARINAKLSAYTESDPVFNTSLAKGITAQDTAYWNQNILPPSGNTTGNILYWNGTSWVRLAPGLPGQQLSLSPQGHPTWTSTTGTTLPMVTTLPISSVTHGFVGEVPVFQATVGASVSLSSDEPLLGKGVVCGTNDNPTFSNATKSFQINGLSGAGAYTGVISGLSPDTTYKCRAYAVIGTGIVYGEQQAFTTSPQGAVSSLDCAGATLSADLVAGKPIDSVIITLPYTGGNGGVYASRSTSSTGLAGLTASLASGTLMQGAGNLQYVLTGDAPVAGTANFNISIGGQSCALTLMVLGDIAALNCAGATFSAQFVRGVAANGITATVPYTGGTGNSHTGQVVASTGVTGLTATLLPGNFAQGTGNLTYTITGTPSDTGTASFALNIGGRVCTLTKIVLGPGSLFTMKNIPAGTFSMGCITGDPSCNPVAEYPVRAVTLSAFRIGETEVTQEQWQAVMGSNPSYFSSCAQCPVEQVSWRDALVFCNRLSEAEGLTPCYYSDPSFTQLFGKSGGTWSLYNDPAYSPVYWKPSTNGYRLPTEAEWEYAARGGSATNLYSGSNNVDQVAWYASNSGSRTKPVKGKQSNGYGLYDMSGNVAEAVWDWFYQNYPSYSETNPKGPTGGQLLVRRGGSWGSPYPYFCRVTDRSVTDWSSRELATGFRIVLAP